MGDSTLMPAPRAALIRVQLDHHFQVDVQVPVATPEPAMWWKLVQDGALRPVAILGWAPPFMNPDHDPTLNNAALIVPYCPEIIDEQTGDLSEDNLKKYLEVIEFVIDGHIVHWQEIEDVEVRHKLIETDLARDFPWSYEMLQERLAMANLRYSTSDDTP